MIKKIETYKQLKIKTKNITKKAIPFKKLKNKLSFLIDLSNEALIDIKFELTIFF